MSDEGAVPAQPLVEGIDYYREGAYLVFTEAFLKRRGYCCESGCRHCPWDFRKNRSTDRPFEDGTE